MMEIMIDECDWSGRVSRLTEIIERLKNSGWRRFGRSGMIVLFKETTEERAHTELEKLQINELSVEELDENYSDMF